MISKNIKYYRLIKSMSKKDLAEAVNVTPMAISNYENGKRKPEIDILKKIANVLGVRVADFLNVRNENIQFSHNEFRKSSSLPKNTQEYIFESIEEYFSRFMDAVEILGGDVLPTFPKCHYLEITKDVEKDALNLRRYLGFADNGPIDDLIGSLENKGFLVLLKEIDDDKFSAINGFVNNHPYIMLNKKMTIERNRSTIAHELAHLMFNWDNVDMTEKEIENYATAIGGAFLFPKEDAIRELGVHRRSVSKDMILVATEYGISMFLLAKRAEILKIISESSSRKFYILASEKGWRKNEPSRIEKLERPILFEQLVYRAINENEISIQRGAELLKKPYDKVANDCLFDSK